jgi:hypothetical protein
MAYVSTIRRLLTNDYANYVKLPPVFQRLRNILMHSNRNGLGAENDISRLLKLAYEYEVKSYLKIFVDNDVQFEKFSRSSATESFDLMKIHNQLLSPEGWFEEEVFQEANKYIDQEVWVPLRERAYIKENPIEVISIAVTIFCLVANEVMRNVHPKSI